MGIDGGTLRQWRRSRGRDVPAMARELRRAAGGESLAAHDALIRMIRRWERKGLTTERYELLYRSLGFEDAPADTKVNEHATTASSPAETVVQVPARNSGAALPSDTAGLELAGRLDYTLRHPADVDLVTVACLRQQVQQLDERYVHVPSAALLADVGQYLGQVRFLTAHAPRSSVRRELHAVEAEAATLMGQLVWDASQRRGHDSAQAYLDQAASAARQIRDPAAEGLALLRKTMIALYGERDPRAGLHLAAQTAQTAGRVSEVLTGLAMLHEAEAHAMLGDRPSCEAALSAAETQMNRITDMDTALSLYSDTQLGRMAGSCYLSLGDAGRAQELLESTAAALNDGSKSVPIVLGNLALALIRKRDLDEAAGRLHQAMDVIELNWGGGGLNIVFEAGRQLRRHRSVPAVQDVHDRMLSLMAS